MEAWGWFQRLRYGVRQAVGLGFLAGAVETVGQATALELPLSVLDLAAMGVVAVLLMGAVGALAGAVAGLVVLPDARRDALTSQVVASQLAAAGVLLCGFYLWQAAFLLWDADQPAGGVAMAAMPLGFGGVIYYNARFWLRRAELDKAPKHGWVPAAGLAALGVVVAAAALYPLRDTGGRHALEGDPNVLVVLVDGLGRSDLASGAVPALEGLASQGIAFADAVTPATESAPAVAAVLTGLHPLRHKLLFDGDTLGAGYRTLAEVFDREGYATGGFVSHEAVGVASGLAQGFRVYDDDFAALLPGVARLVLVTRVRQLWGLVFDHPPGSRGPEVTVERFLVWYDQHRDHPHFGLVHLRVGDGGPAAINAALERVLGAVDDAGRRSDTLVVVAGAHGRPDGRRFLTDAEVRVPLVVRAGGRPVLVPVVPHQVRLMDVAATVMEFVRLDTLGETEGVSLLGYGQGDRQAPLSCALVGRDDAGAPILGMRNAGVKWVRDAADADHLFNLTDDPGETRDLAVEQEKAVRQARSLMSPDVVAFRTLLELR